MRIVRKILKVIGKLLKWALRIACAKISNFELMPLVIMDIIFTALSLSRLSRDSIGEVITGFMGDGDIGFYEYTDNSGRRVFGWIFFILAFLVRVDMVAELLF